MQTVLLRQRWTLLLGLLLTGSAAWAGYVPYTPDLNTLFLFHCDEPAGAAATTNEGVVSGVAYSVNMSSATSNPPLLTSVFGAVGLGGFGSAANCNGTGYSVGFDADESGAYQGESVDLVNMIDLNMGNGGVTPWTLEALIFPSVTNVNQEIITTDSSATARGFQFRLNTSAQLELNLIGAGINPKTAIPSTGTHAFAAGNWYHVAATYDGAQIVLYWTKVSTNETVAHPISTNAAVVDQSFGSITGPLVIGNENRGPAGEQFRGLIDEVRVSSVARPPNAFIFTGGASPANYIVITQPPTNTSVASGGSVQFSVAADTSYPPLFYRWYAGSPGTGTPVVSPDANGATYTGLTGPVLAMNNAPLSNNGKTFYCVVTNGHNPPVLATSTVALLNVSNPVVVPADPAAPGGLMVNLLAHPERTTIPDTAPKFSWIFKSTERGEFQAAYQIIVSSSPTLAANTNGNVWNSGEVVSGDSVDVAFSGLPLLRGSNYTWRVRNRGSAGNLGPWSSPQSFTIEPTLPLAGARSIRNRSANQWSGRYQPAFDTTVVPASFVDKGGSNYFIDFGRAGFGYVTLRLNGNFAGQSVQVRLGEKASGTSVNTSPGGTIRYGSTTVVLANGDITYDVHKASTTTGINISWSGGVMPFRYVELLNCPGTVTADDIRQRVLHVPFDDAAASFDSSDDTLNAVWELCHHSIKVTSFCGVYVDGDRERKPYEADAYMNQLSHYAVDREFATARYSYEYLLDNPTWPTEWRLHFAPMAWADYLATGNADALAANYESLKTQLLTNWIRASDGIMVSQTSGTPMDIVDWPAGERDGYVLTSVNSVVNAFHYQALRRMAQVASALGNSADASDFTARADTLKNSFNTVFWNASSQLYQDGETTTHISAHANFFPLAFGLVPSNRVSSVVAFLKSKRMPCSVYGAQYLLEALFEAGEADSAIALMADNDPAYKRHWWNMLLEGSTVTLEAWDNDFKSNLDWNHAWGAAPANIIPRYVLGLQPLTPGYGRVEIMPQLGTGTSSNGLTTAAGTIPTIRGPVSISAENSTNSFALLVNIPGNMTANVLLPTKGFTNAAALIDGNMVSGAVSNGWFTVTNVGSGQHAIALGTTQASLAVRYDNWARAYFGTNSGNAALAGQSADPDHDGFDNYSEFVAASDPLDQGSLLRIESANRNPSTQVVQVSLEGRVGRRYFLETTSQLGQPVWNVVMATSVLATNQALVLQDSGAGTIQKFYRVRVNP